jgi:hypothetical protein
MMRRPMQFIAPANHSALDNARAADTARRRKQQSDIRRLLSIK